MTHEEAVTHWRKRAFAELKAAKALFNSNDPEFYGEVLFHCHLALELALKSQYIHEKDDAAPFSHSLSELASLLQGTRFDDDQDEFDQITEFAILARYGDSKWFSANATKSNAAQWVEKTEQYLSKIFS